MNQNASHRDIHITLKVFGGLRESFHGGTQSVVLPPQATLADLLATLKTREPDLSCKLQAGLDAGYLNTLINGRNVYFLRGHDTVLNDGDTVAFLPPVGGG
jgi:molybdopterin converting factor small subunit